VRRTASTDDDVYFMNANGDFSHFVFDGITLENFAMIQDGIITLSNQTDGETITDWTFRNVDIQQVAPADPSAQVIYLGERFDDFLLEDSVLRGPTRARASRAAPASRRSPTTGPRRRTSSSGAPSTSACSRGRPVLQRRRDRRDHAQQLHRVPRQHRPDAPLDVLVRDNAGENGDDANLYDPDPTGTTADHNFWGQTFNPDPDFTLSGRLERHRRGLRRRRRGSSAAVSVRDDPVLFLQPGKKATGGSVLGGNAIATTKVHRLDGPEHEAANDTTRLDASTDEPRPHAEAVGQPRRRVPRRRHAGAGDGRRRRRHARARSSRTTSPSTRPSPSPCTARRCSPRPSRSMASSWSTAC
jgi:hypothetical protein